MASHVSLPHVVGFMQTVCPCDASDELRTLVQAINEKRQLGKLALDPGIEFRYPAVTEDQHDLGKRAHAHATVSHAHTLSAH
eukprot:5697869-Amphidinium_carterae.1